MYVHELLFCELKIFQINVCVAEKKSCELFVVSSASKDC